MLAELQAAINVYCEPLGPITDDIDFSRMPSTSVEVLDISHLHLSALETDEPPSPTPTPHHVNSRRPSSVHQDCACLHCLVHPPLLTSSADSRSGLRLHLADGSPRGLREVLNWRRDNYWVWTWHRSMRRTHLCTGGRATRSDNRAELERVGRGGGNHQS